MTKVALGALVRGGRVLLGHRSPTKHVRPDVWDLPGGVVEAGESDLAALARELEEELGIQVARESAALLCQVTVETGSDPIDVTVWLVGEWRGTPANLAPEEHLDIGWFGPSDLPTFVHAQVSISLVEVLVSHQP